MRTRFIDSFFAQMALLLLAFALAEAAVLLLPRWSIGGRIFAAALILLVALLLAYALARPHHLAALRLRATAGRIAEGDYSARAWVPESGALAEAGASLNRLAASLERRASEQLVEREQASEILAVMTDGVLVLDSQARIVLANAAASRLLSAPVDDSFGERLVDLVHAFPAKEMLAKALLSNAPTSAKFEAPGPRYLSMQLVPLYRPTELERGDPEVLFILHDETSRVATARMRRDFAANVSHELKTPLAGLKLLSDTLQHALVEDPEAAKRFAGRLSTEIARLSDLVSDLLALSSLERATPQGEPVTEEFDLARLATEVGESLAERAERERQKLDIQTPSPVFVRGDPVQLSTLIRNLLDNALRYTDPEGHIVLAVGTTPAGWAVLTVRDSGIGIPQAEQSRIFERFYRVDKDRSRETGGTGLGLSIVKHIAERHGGRVEVESTVGLGSTFSVYLPAAEKD